MQPDHRAATLSANFITAPTAVHGRQLRPLSAASFSILKRTENAFVTGSEDPDRKLASAMEFIFVHGAPIQEVIEATRLLSARSVARELGIEVNEVTLEDRTDAMLERFRAAVLKYNAEIPIELEPDAADAIAAETEAAGSAIVEPKPKEDGEEFSDPN